MSASGLRVEPEGKQKGQKGQKQAKFQPVFVLFPLPQNLILKMCPDIRRQAY
jgi:hypothetical protein